MAELAVEARDLSKTFNPGGVIAVNGLDLAVPRGSVFGLIGRNGAGKTTTLRMLMGLLRPNRGQAEILGRNLWSADPAHRSRVAYVSQNQQLHAWMTLAELAAYVAAFYPRWDASRARRLADLFDLPWQRQAGLLSGGEQRKVSILLALATGAEVLVLDEPAGGLDPIARRQLIDEIIAAVADGDGVTVLFSTHIITDLERVAEHVGIMDRGHMVRAGRLDEIQSSTRRVQVIFEGDRPPADFAVPGAIRVQTAGPVVNAVVKLLSDRQLDDIRRLPGVRVNVFPLGLEEQFIELLGPQAGSELTEVQQ